MRRIICNRAPPTARVRLASGRPLSPKRPIDERAGLGDIFPYYAGFSYEWACTQMAAHGLPAQAVVLDPWNGSGTTTIAAQSLGWASVGVDLNPVACIVARLKVLGPGGSDLIAQVPKRCGASYEAEPLLAWFTRRTAARIRDWAQTDDIVSSRLSALVTKVSLLRVVRTLTKRYEGSNPTWVRIASDDGDRIEIDDAILGDLIRRVQIEIASRLSMYPRTTTTSVILVGNANQLPLADSSIDAILTSPPYLTRIDYAVAYSRELAVLGFAVGRDRSAHSRSLRANLMGTTLIRRDGGADRAGADYSSAASELVHRVASHPSKASSGYYLKQIRQYLDDLGKGLAEASRVARPGAVMTIVVQDSSPARIPRIGHRREHVEELAAQYLHTVVDAPTVQRLGNRGH